MAAVLDRLGPRAVAFVAGAVLPLAYAPFGLFPLAVLAPAVLFWLWLDTPPREAAWRGFWFGVGMFGVGVSWVFVAFHDFGYAGIPLSTLLTGLFVAFLALYPALFGYLAARLFPGGNAIKMLCVLPAGWVLFEWLRGWFLTGFPWLHLGYSQIDSPLRGLAPVVGVYGVSLATAVSAALLLAALRRRRRPAALSVLLALWLVAGLAARVDWTAPSGPAFAVSLIQGNIPQEVKWRPEALNHSLDLYRQLTLAQTDARLILWPEAAVPAFYHEVKDFYLAPLAQILQTRGQELILGIPVLDAGSRRYYNSMVVMGREPGVYHKRHLVPFGDFVPLEKWLRGLIRFFDLPMSGFSPGPSAQPLLHAAGHTVAVAICYEDAFGEEWIPGLPEAALLVNATNNAWYGNSLAPHQHLEISRMRALETGRYLLRVTTNGVSAIVAPDGVVVAAAPQFKTYTLNGTVRPMAGATPYVRTGNIPVLLVAVSALGIALRLSLLRRQHPG